MNNYHLYFKSSGTGPPVILLHGLASSHREWDWLVPDIVSAGFQVFTPDLLGHGQSPHPEEKGLFCFEELERSFQNWLLQTKIKPPYFLVGHSLGGYLSLLTAFHTPPNVMGMVLVSPFYSKNQINRLYKGIIANPRIGEYLIKIANKHIINYMLLLSKPVLGKYPDRARWQMSEDYTRTAPASMHLPSTVSDLTPILPHIQAETIVIWGCNDLVLNPESFDLLVENLVSVKGYPLDKCGHEPHLTNFPVFNRLVINFLTEHKI